MVTVGIVHWKVIMNNTMLAQVFEIKLALQCLSYDVLVLSTIEWVEALLDHLLEPEVAVEVFDSSLDSKSFCH